MKTANFTYWATTLILAAMMTVVAIAYLVQPSMAQMFHHLGFPDYFRVELAVAKLLGVAALVFPVGARLKEWAYAGFGITFISAIIAHSSVGDPLSYRAVPFVALALLVTSYLTLHQRNHHADDGRVMMA
ncbi:DoxX family protein [Hymenobacter armeniacus]|uniref:DoxX family protein n=1 Tax=Hymenobacter armeniacus TaxID=2771358 RepID=A0ABR8JQP1_9BACT|nr:DoxX family protein [Hymenobacter armeniacus]MBD2721083.1 DoxX family protein [Hymenobacter armeniacus]